MATRLSRLFAHNARPFQRQFLINSRVQQPCIHYIQLSTPTTRSHMITDSANLSISRRHLLRNTDKDQTYTGATLRHVGSISFKYIKYAVIAASSITVAGYLSWQALHLYLEHLHPTPRTFPSKARALLRAAYVREEIFPDFVVARLYLKLALRHIILAGMDENDPSVMNVWLRMAEDQIRNGDIIEGTNEYARLREILIRNKLENKAALVSKRLGELYTRLGDFTSAEAALVWALRKLIGRETGAEASEKETSPFVLAIENPDKVTPELAGCMVAIAGLYAMQREYQHALTLYLGTLKMIQARRSLELKDDETSDNWRSISQIPWECLEAIIAGNIGELYFGMGKEDEAVSWLQNGLNICLKNMGKRDCAECAGVILGNIGLIQEVKGDREQALANFMKAVEYANIAGDEVGRIEYEKRLDVLNVNADIGGDRSEGSREENAS
ncbi:uncharacterized protein VTP21DRAFT_8618 [Calcarisporiella thermophila]|uniref:uncharacterized protein n=1 Tax=Calcarisporiella thermophila TaxID=911321 RepID=UPI003742B505